MEKKNKRLPIKTFGWERGNLNLETSNPKTRKIKGKKMAVQEKSKIRKSLILIRAKPLLEKEIRISPAIKKKVTCATE